MQTPKLASNPVQPSLGPKSGGTTITISGQHIGSGTSHSVSIGGVTCTVTNVGVAISCTTVGGTVGEQSLSVAVDEWSVYQGTGFQYVDDPTFESVEPMISFAA